MKPINIVLEKIPGPKRKNGKNTICHCPAHEDRKASLSVSEASDGKVLLYCFSGCTTTDIVSSIGLKMRDLFPRGGRRY